METVKTVICMIGSFLVMLLILSIPALCALSFAFDWRNWVKALFTILTICVHCPATIYVSMWVEKG